MRRNFLLVLSLTLASAGTLHAGTFTPAPIAPEFGLDVLNRDVARAQVGRDLFSNPYATVTISNVDVYDRFPYLESRQFHVVSDPRWNRLVCGEPGRSLAAFDGRGTSIGALADPRGMAVDESNRVYVADAGNNRIVVLQAVTEYDRISLTPLFAIDGMHQPYDVAYSDGGTPFQSGDDLLYVADTGANRIVAMALEGSSARLVASIGELGSSPGRFAGPMAITVGRANGASTRDVYVADAHNQRIVHLTFEKNSLRWISDARHQADVLTSLDTDEWGNLYAAAPHQGVIEKFNANMDEVAELKGSLSRPTSFEVPFVNTRDHRDGRQSRAGQMSAISVESWSGEGVRRWNLGVSVEQLAIASGAEPAASFMLTDQAAVSLEVSDVATGRTLSRRAVGTLPAGAHRLPLLPEDFVGAKGDVSLRVAAASSYPNGPSDAAQATFQANGASLTVASEVMLLGNTPNPAPRATRIAFLLPAGQADEASLSLFDAAGRRVRTFSKQFNPGMNDVLWDGSDDEGKPVRAGVYFYRLDVGRVSFTRRMVLVR